MGYGKEKMNKEYIKEIIEDYNRKQSIFKEKYKKRGEIRTGVHIYIKFDYISSANLLQILNAYRDSISEAIKTEVKEKYNIDKSDKKIKILRKLPLEIISVQTGNSLDLIMGLNPFGIELTNILIALLQNQGLSMIEIYDWIGRIILGGGIIRAVKQRLLKIESKENITQVELEDYRGVIENE